MQRIDGLLRRFGQLRQRFADLLRAGRLRLHPFVHGFELRRQCLDLADDLRQLFAHLFDFLHTSAHLFGKLVHTHYTGRNRRLHLLDKLFDVVTRYSSLVRKTPNLSRDNSEPASMLACLFRFDGRIEREQIVWSATFVMVVTTWLMLLAFSFKTASLALTAPPASITCRMVASMRANPLLTGACQISRLLRTFSHVIDGLEQHLGGRRDLL